MNEIVWIQISEALTDSELSVVEETLSLKIPDSLKQHYLSQNGGIPECRKLYFVPPGSSQHDVDQVSFRAFNPIKYKVRPKQETLEEIFADFKDQNLFDSTRFIPFAFDVSAFPFLMDVQTEEIYLLDRDDVDDEGHERIKFVAKSLEVFISGFIPWEIYEAEA